MEILHHYFSYNFDTLPEVLLNVLKYISNVFPGVSITWYRIENVTNIYLLHCKW